MYISGTATDIADLITKIKDFCVNNNPGYPAYTLENFSADGTGSRLHISKNSRYFNFRSVSNEALPVGGASGSSGIYMNAGTGYNSSNPWYDQTGVFKYNNSANYLITGMNKITSAIVSYHFFYFKLTGDYDTIYIIVESPNGTYNRLMFGRLGTLSIGTHWGTVPDGMFYCGSVKHSNTNYSMALSFLGGSDVGWLSESPSGAVYGTSGAFTGWMSGDFNIPQSQMPSVTPQVFDTSVKLHSVDLCSPNTFNSMPPLFPITVNVTSPTLGMTSTTPWFPAAEFPFLYIVNLFNISPGSQISIGSDTYKVFPFRKKSDTWVSNSPDNGTYRLGFAIKTS